MESYIANYEYDKFDKYENDMHNKREAIESNINDLIAYGDADTITIKELKVLKEFLDDEIKLLEE